MRNRPEGNDKKPVAPAVLILVEQMILHNIMRSGEEKTLKKGGLQNPVAVYRVSRGWKEKQTLDNQHTI
jgi:hypothetical protein